MQSRFSQKGSRQYTTWIMWHDLNLELIFSKLYSQAAYYIFDPSQRWARNGTVLRVFVPVPLPREKKALGQTGTGDPNIVSFIFWRDKWNLSDGFLRRKVANKRYSWKIFLLPENILYQAIMPNYEDGSRVSIEGLRLLAGPILRTKTSLIFLHTQ